MKLIIFLIVLFFPIFSLASPIKGGYKFESSGWYMLGWVNQGPLSMVEIDDQDGIIETIWKWDGDQWSFYSPVIDDAGFELLQEIYRSEGFWMHVNGPGVIYWQCPDYTISNKIVAGGIQYMLFSCAGNLMSFAMDDDMDGTLDSIIYYDKHDNGLTWRVRTDSDADGIIDDIRYVGGVQVVK